MNIRSIDGMNCLIYSGGPTDVLGIDVGATLCKIVSEQWGDPMNCSVMLSRNVDGIAEFVATRKPTRVALTGCGARALRERLCCASMLIDEFPAWCRGARELIHRFEVLDSQTPFLLVSLGTGTLIFKVHVDERGFIGSTALGGAAIGGLGRLVGGVSDFDSICGLAECGDRAKVDLWVGDVYPEAKFDLPRSLTASSFGRVTRDVPSEPADRLAALIWMVGESVALLCAAHARLHNVRHVVVGGSAIQRSAILRRALKVTLLHGGCHATVLRNGDYTGAIGALSLMRECH
jgi:type II pantothenate kinase